MFLFVLVLIRCCCYVFEQVKACHKLLVQQSAFLSTEDKERKRYYVTYLSLCSERFVDLIGAGSAGAYSEELFGCCIKLFEIVNGMVTTAKVGCNYCYCFYWLMLVGLGLINVSCMYRMEV